MQSTNEELWKYAVENVDGTFDVYDNKGWRMLTQVSRRIAEDAARRLDAEDAAAPDVR